MNKIREIIRLDQDCNLSQRAIARALSVSRSVVSDYLQRIKSSGLDFKSAQGLDDDTLLKTLKEAEKFPLNVIRDFERNLNTLPKSSNAPV